MVFFAVFPSFNIALQNSVVRETNKVISLVLPKGVASTFEVVRPGSRSGLLWVCQEVGVVSFCCRLHVLFYF